MNVPNLKQSFDITFEYKQNNTVVVCFVKPRFNMSYILNHDKDPVYNRRYFKGVAILKDGDQNQLSIACDIARKKAMRSYYKEVKNLGREYWEEMLNNCIDKFEYIKKLDNKINALTDEIVKAAYKED